MAENKSDIVGFFEKKERIRTTNYRGSLLCTTCVLDKASSAGDVTYLTPISYSASIKNINVGGDGSGGEVKYFIYGIGQNGEYSKASIGTITPGDGKTIYEALCDVSGKPEDNFKPYKDNRYGMLAMTNDQEMPVNSAIQIMFVEGAPSEAPLISKIVKSRIEPRS